MAEIELQSMRGRVGSGSESSATEYATADNYETIDIDHQPARDSTEQISQTNSLTSVRSLVNRLQSLFSLFLKSESMTQLLCATFVCLGHMMFFFWYRTSAFLFLLTDLPTRLLPCTRKPECNFPQPCGQNTHFRPHIALLKIGSLTIIGYILFVIVNCTQLTINARYNLSVPCVLALYSCQPKFSICAEVKNISEDEFYLINYFLASQSVKIQQGNLVTLPSQPILVDMSDTTPIKSAFTAQLAKSTARMSLKGKEILQ